MTTTTHTIDTEQLALSALLYGAAAVRAIAQGLRPLLVHAIALCLLLAGYRPAPAAPAAPCFAPPPLPARIRPTLLPSLPVTQLRTLARHRLGSSTRIDGRRIAQATKAALLLALLGEVA